MNLTNDKQRKTLRIIWAIAAKDIVDGIKNKTTITLILGMAMLMLSAQVLPLVIKLRDLPSVVVYDAGESHLIEELGASSDVELHQVTSQQALEETIGEATLSLLGLVIPAGDDQMTRTDGHLELEGYVAHSADPAEVAEQVDFLEARLTELAGQTVRIDIEGNTVFPQPDSDGQPFMVSVALVLATIIVGAFLVPFLMIEEKETHTMEALLVSPASYSEIVVGKALAGIVYCLSAAAIVFAFSQSMVNHWGLAILGAVCGSLFAVAVGLLMGVLFDNPATMSLWMGLVVIVLTVPVLLVNTMASSWPEILKTVLPWIPSVALGRLFRISFSADVPLAQVLPQLAVVLGSAGLILTLVVLRVRRMDL